MDSSVSERDRSRHFSNLSLPQESPATRSVSPAARSISGRRQCGGGGGLTFDRWKNSYEIEVNIFAPRPMYYKVGARDFSTLCNPILSIIFIEN